MLIDIGIIWLLCVAVFLHWAEFAPNEEDF